MSISCLLLQKRISLKPPACLIDNQNKKLATIKQEITDLEAQLKTKFSSAQLKELLQKCDAQISAYKTETQHKKMEKYRRDTMDYRNNNVYPWLWDNHDLGGRPRQRQRQQNTVSSASSGDWSIDTDSSMPRRFLRSNTDPF
ncbi:unnamed protein product [Leuciscus chuanchicus]